MKYSQFQIKPILFELQRTAHTIVNRNNLSCNYLSKPYMTNETVKNKLISIMFWQCQGRLQQAK